MEGISSIENIQSSNSDVVDLNMQQLKETLLSTGRCNNFQMQPLKPLPFSPETSGNGVLQTPIYYLHQGKFYPLKFMLNEQNDTASGLAASDAGSQVMNLNCDTNIGTTGGALETPYQPMPGSSWNPPQANFGTFDFEAQQGTFGQPDNWSTEQSGKKPEMITEEMRAKLELYYSLNTYITPSQSFMIAEEIGLEQKRVLKWFQQKRNNAANRRRRAMKKMAIRD